jgi:ABC-type multidrug transport system fused ATPase/permease subunit
LLVAHRLATVQSADRIIVLDRGQVVEAGTWDELVQRPKGMLRRMAELQGYVLE